MKKLFGILSAGVAFASFAATTQAQIVSVDFNDSYGQTLSGYNGYTGSDANYTAGVASAGNGQDYFVQNWNDSTPPGGDRSGTDSPLHNSGSLITSTGATSGIGFSLAYSWADNTGSTNSNFPKPDGSNSFPFYQNTGNANAVLGGSGVAISSGTLSLALSGLSTTDNYTLVAYVSALYFAGPTTAEWSLGSQNVFTDPTNNSGLTGWVQGTASSAGTAVPSNFVEFDNVTAPTGSLTLTGVGVGSGQPAIMGFQIIDTGAAAPEPASAWLVLAGFAGLGVYLRRKRSSQG